MSETKSVLRALEILNTFSFENPRQRVIDIASKLGMTVSTVSRHLSTLTDAGMLTRNETDGYYELGNHFLHLAGVVLSNSELYKYAYPELRALNAKTGLRSYLGILFDRRYMCIANSGYQYANDLFTPFGYSYPLHSTAIGKVLLAYIPESKLEYYLERDNMAKFANNTITDKVLLRKELQKIRVQGYSTIDSESLQDVASVAAPIFDKSKKVIGGISVSDHLELVNLKEREPELAKIVLSSAREISKHLGYYPHGLR